MHFSPVNATTGVLMGQPATLVAQVTLDVGESYHYPGCLSVSNPRPHSKRGNEPLCHQSHRSGELCLCQDVVSITMNFDQPRGQLEFLTEKAHECDRRHEMVRQMFPPSTAEPQDF
jgi:hypothetical protein